MYSTSLNQRIGNLVEKNSLSLSKGTIVSDAVIAMKEKGVSSILVASDYSMPSYHARPSEAEPTPTRERPFLSYPIEGIVTERDILYRIIADKRDPMKVTLGEIMSSPIIAVDEKIQLKDAISLMRRKRIRRLLVTASARIEGSDIGPSEQKIDSKGLKEVVPLGTVTLMSIVGNMPLKSLELAEIEIPLSASQVSSNSGDTTNIEEGRITIVCPYCESKFDNTKDLSKHIDRIHLGSGLLEGDIRQW